MLVKNLLKPVRTIEKTQTKKENEFEAIKLRKTETVNDKSQSNILQSNIRKENEFREVKLRKTESLTNNEREDQSSKSKFRKKNSLNNNKENILRNASVLRKKSLERQEIITEVGQNETEIINLEGKETHKSKLRAEMREYPGDCERRRVVSELQKPSQYSSESFLSTFISNPSNDIVISDAGRSQREFLLCLASFVCFIGFLAMIAMTETKQASHLINKELESNQSFNYDYFDIIKWP